MADITHNLIIHSAPLHIYQAIATQEGVRHWWTLQADIESHIGGMAEFRFGEKYYLKMEITALVSKQEVRWKCLVGDQQWVGTEISFDLEEKNGETLLRFGHVNWSSQTEFFGHCNFQWGRYLMSLKNYCEDGQGQPFNPDDQPSTN